MRLATVTKIGIAGLTLAAALGAGSARAGIPSPDGSIDGCLNPTTGALRAVDTQAGQGCSSFERTVRWNLAGQQGTVGPAGPAGPAGPEGPQGPPGPAGADTLIVSKRFPRATGTPGSLAAGEIPGCAFESGVGTTCGRLDVGAVTLPPGTWEVTAQLLADVSARTVFDPSRFIRCDVERSSSDKIEMKMDDNEEDYRMTWTWIVNNPGPGDLAWTLGCVVHRPLFGSLTDKTYTYISYAVIIARPVGQVIVQ